VPGVVPVPVPVPPPPVPDPGALERILLLSTDRLGDLVWTTPAIRHVRELCPRARLTLVASRGAASVVAGSPRLDEVVTVETETNRLLRALGHARLGARLRGRRFDLAIEFNRSSEHRWLLRFARPARTAGTRAGQLVGRERPETRHIARHRLDLVESLFGVPARSPRQEVFPSEGDRARAARIIEERGLSGGFAVIHAGTSNTFRYRSLAWLKGPRIAHRNWFEERFAEVARALIARGLGVVFTGVRAEAEAVVRIARALGDAAPRAVDLCGRTTPLELAALLERARLYVGADTGPTHIAAAVGAPLVALYGPQTPLRSGPFEPAGPHRVHYEPPHCSPCGTRVRKRCQDNICMKAITADAVLRSCEELLARPAGAPS
jgi:ADP-heptose:LPS heptosyltransferase